MEPMVTGEDLLKPKTGQWQILGKLLTLSLISFDCELSGIGVIIPIEISFDLPLLSSE